jgi:hypothetical protein
MTRDNIIILGSTQLTTKTTVYINWETTSLENAIHLSGVPMCASNQGTVCAPVADSQLDFALALAGCGICSLAASKENIGKLHQILVMASK